MRQRTTARSEAKRATGEEALHAAVAMDYPQEGETITSRDYTLRISAAPQAKLVEACIDQGPWLPCREAAGFWWYDWSGFAAGRHQLRARMTDQDGNVKMTLLRWAQVEETR